MDETVLKDFFLGKASSADLANDLQDEIRQLGQTFQTFYVRDLVQEFRIDRMMLVKLLDAVLAGELQAAALEPIGFALYTSDRFEWEEDDVISNVLTDWSAPQINYPLTLENMERFKRWLLATESYPEKPPFDPSRPQGKLITRTERKRLE